MEVDWRALFTLGMSPLELVIRGSAVYWFLFLLFRMLLRRDVGAISVADVLLVVLIADAAQNAMAGEYRSITDGAVLVSTIIGWNLLIDWLAFRFSRVRRILEPGPLPLVRDGSLLRGNLRREWMSVEDVLGKLREHGVDHIAQVRTAHLESDGQVSVVKRDRGPFRGNSRRSYSSIRALSRMKALSPHLHRLAFGARDACAPVLHLGARGDEDEHLALAHMRRARDTTRLAQARIMRAKVRW